MGFKNYQLNRTMTNIILINNPTKSPIAETVLELNGFEIVSNWALEGIYKKDGKDYNFTGWAGDKVKIKLLTTN